jgi:hypothetical protein
VPAASRLYALEYAAGIIRNAPLVEDCRSGASVAGSRAVSAKQKVAGPRYRSLSKYSVEAALAATFL